MNQNSVICRFMAEHPKDYENRIIEKNIRITKKENLAIFNYDICADFSDPLVQEARGIIIDMDTFDVVCWPFRKFGNYTESYADTIDWSSAKVQEKVDGSIIKLYFYRGAWHFATNGCIDAVDAPLASDVGPKNYDMLIREAVNFKDIPFVYLDIQTTYIFELVSPYNRVVISYDEPILYHLGARNNLTGEEYDIDIHIRKPKEYFLYDLEGCIEAAKQLNTEDKVEYEGFVVVDKDWHRVKIKSPSYIALHHFINNGFLTKERIISLLLEQPENAEWIEKEYKAYAPAVAFYRYAIINLYDEVERYIHIVRAYYKEYGYDRKALAKTIGQHKYASLGFQAIDNPDKGAKDLLKNIRLSLLLKVLPDYHREDFKEWF